MTKRTLVGGFVLAAALMGCAGPLASQAANSEDPSDKVRLTALAWVETEYPHSIRGYAALRRDLLRQGIDEGALSAVLSDNADNLAAWQALVDSGAATSDQVKDAIELVSKMEAERHRWRLHPDSGANDGDQALVIGTVVLVAVTIGGAAAVMYMNGSSPSSSSPSGFVVPSGVGGAGGDSSVDNAAASYFGSGANASKPRPRGNNSGGRPPVAGNRSPGAPANGPTNRGSGGGIVVPYGGPTNGAGSPGPNTPGGSTDPAGAQPSAPDPKVAFGVCMSSSPPRPMRATQGDGFGVAQGALLAALNAASSCQGPWQPCAGQVRDIIGAARGGPDPIASLAMWTAQIQRVIAREGNVPVGPWWKDPNNPLPQCTQWPGGVPNVPGPCWNTMGGAQDRCVPALASALDDVNCSQKHFHFVVQAEQDARFQQALDDFTQKCRDSSGYQGPPLAPPAN
jgi:hypothetical protein